MTTTQIDTLTPLEAQHIALELMQEFLGGTNWKFRWDRAVRRAGQCNYSTKTISVSIKLLPDMGELDFRNTVLHEIAHALAGPRAGHSYAWKSIHMQIGGTGERCAHITPSVQAPWVGVCPNGHTNMRHRMTDKARRVSCGLCSPSYNSAYRFTWTKTA